MPDLLEAMYKEVIYKLHFKIGKGDTNFKVSQLISDTIIIFKLALG